jgi:formylglycine-generating enzyme required for sulfatase activity
VAEFARFVEDTGYRTDAERERQGDPREERPPRANVAAAKGTWRNPGFAQSPGDPVVEVSWNDAAAFCRWLGEKEGHRYRLPTEAEWEYACRAGTATRYSFGDGENDLEAYGWFAANAGRSPHPAGQKKPNGWGLYDMHGNVEEWCQDWYDPVAYEKAPPLDLGGPEAGSRRVIRGGGWNDAAAACRSACRRSDEPANHSPARGFRVVLAR